MKLLVGSPLCAVLVGAALLSACGDGDESRATTSPSSSAPSTASAREITLEWWQALAAGDVNSACDLASPSFASKCPRQAAFFPAKQIDVNEVTGATSKQVDNEMQALAQVCVPPRGKTEEIPVWTVMMAAEGEWEIIGLIGVDPAEAEAPSDFDLDEIREAC